MNRHLRAAGPLLISHYKRLNHEQKKSIRKFEFLQLPLELRNLVYRHLLLAKCDQSLDWQFATTRVGIVSITEVGILPVSWNGAVDDVGVFNGNDRLAKSSGLNLLLTCRQIYAEGHKFIAENNILRLGGNSGYNANRFDGTKWVFPEFIKVEWVRRLQVHIIIDPYVQEPMDMNWKYIFGEMARLKEVQMAVAYKENFNIYYHPSEQQGDPPGPYLNAGSLKGSAVINGLIATAIMNIPKDVNIRWGPWSALTTAEHRWDLPISYDSFLSPLFLMLIAKQYEPLRGMACESEDSSEIKGADPMEDMVDDDMTE